MRTTRLLISIVSIVSILLPQASLAETSLLQNQSVYRLYNAAMHDHFYTASQEEATAAQSGGYILEDTYRFLGSRNLLETQSALYRLWHPIRKHHFYTDRNDEMEKAVLTLGYLPEGKLGFLAADTVDLLGLPVYRLYNPTLGDHLYTIHLSEWVSAQEAGYLDEGTLLGRFYLQ